MGELNPHPHSRRDDVSLRVLLLLPLRSTYYSGTYLEDCCKMTEWGSHYSPFLLQIMGCPSLVVIYSSMILALSRALSVYSIQLPPQSDPCHFRAHPHPPLLPLSWVCNRVKSNQGVWALGGRVETRSCTSTTTIYLLHLLACLLFIPYHLRSTNSLYCVRLPFVGSFQIGRAHV